MPDNPRAKRTSATAARDRDIAPERIVLNTPVVDTRVVISKTGNSFEDVVYTPFPLLSAFTVFLFLFLPPVFRFAGCLAFLGSLTRFPDGAAHAQAAFAKNRSRNVRDLGGAKVSESETFSGRSAGAKVSESETFWTASGPPARRIAARSAASDRSRTARSAAIRAARSARNSGHHSRSSSRRRHLPRPGGR